MATSEYQYVKEPFEVVDEVMAPNIIVVRIGGLNFEEFSKLHEFAKPNDVQALKLMDECAKAVLEEKGFYEIACAYGFHYEYSFVFKKDTKFYKRRGSKLLSLMVSLFTSKYVEKWKEFFPQKELRCPPSFHSRVISCASLEVLRSYLTWRQTDCYDTCLSSRNKKMSEGESNDIFQGSFLLRLKVEEIVKYDTNGTPVKRKRIKVIRVHSKNVTSRSFWNTHPYLLEELGKFEGDICKIKPELKRSFQFENKLLPSTWIVIRIDGCHFHKFSEVHNFVKPNDTHALNLMNSCAMAVVEEFNDILFAYGMSDEYSFILKKDSQFYGRRPSEVVSVITSFFTSLYVMKWKEFFSLTKLEFSPYFDGRAMCYPSNKILLDYLKWRQIDCKINDLYNTCFSVLVEFGGCLNGTQTQDKKTGMTKTEAHKYLKGTRTRDKIELLKNFDIDYRKLPLMFRLGSSIFWDEERTTNKMKGVLEMSDKKVVVDYVNIIDKTFWYEHPHILIKKLKGQS